VDAAGRFAPAADRDSQYGWEAVRLPWRLALDRLWFGEERAARLLRAQFLPFFKMEWTVRGKLPALYRLDGGPLVTYTSPVLYAGVLAAALAAGDQDFARTLAGRIRASYREAGDAAYFAEADNYYANNWAWLGLALYQGWVRP
jgi:endoglucanase